MIGRPDPLALNGRVSIITGAGRGIGAATARLLCRAGARVALVDIEGADLAAHAMAPEGEALPFKADVRDPSAVGGVVDRVIETWGRIDILINNAGVVLDSVLEKVSDHDFAETMDVNLRGTMLFARAVIPQMLKTGFGRILSATSIVARSGNYGQTSYAASKAGIIGMTRTWARELGPKGITANAVAPGFIQTGMALEVPAKIRSQILARTPAGRMGRPEEVANVYLFLASDLASFVNGAIVAVDGGLLL